jgi:MFS-type transporter involved in bile tolerance (Atg22 family)
VLWQPSSKLFAVSRAELLFQGFYPGRLNGSGAAVFVEPRNRRTRGMGATALNSLVPVLGSMLGPAILSAVPLITEDAGIVAISLGVLLGTGIMSLRSPGKAA